MTAVPSKKEVGNSFDVSEHQLLKCLLKQAKFYSPQTDELLPKAEWPLFSKTKAVTKQHLVDEVKLMQHALQKYKIELRTLEIRGKTLYAAHEDQLGSEEREAWESVCELKAEVLKEITQMEKLLGMRMKSIIAGTEVHYDGRTTADLASLQIINQMIELLKEQVYHGNVVSSMDVSGTTHPLLVELETTSMDHEDVLSRGSTSLMDQLTLLQRQIESQQNQTTNVLNSSMKELGNVLLEEIRNSIHSETQDLRYQVQAAEQELQTMKRQMSAPSNLHKKSWEQSSVNDDIPEVANES